MSAINLAWAPGLGVLAVGGTDVVVAEGLSRLDVFHSYVWVLVAAFVVTLCSTPLMRMLAIKYGVIDRPNEARKLHKMPIAYLGGVAVFLGVMAGIIFSYAGQYFPALLDTQQTPGRTQLFVQPGVPFSVLIGLFSIMIVGLVDDVVGTAPRVKIGGQLIAAAALAADDVGVKVAAGFLVPIAKAVGIPTVMQGNGTFEGIAFNIPLPVHFMGVDHIPVDVVYWFGTAVIAVFVIGGCNASNLIDGLDGLLTGVTAIAVAGLLFIALSLAVAGDGERDSMRVVMCMAVLGACLGFLPHNFNPANIFLGDTGSLLLGYCAVVIILTLGDTGKTHMVLAGLVIYAIPLIDTALAIVRRKMAGKKISDADADHLHHMLKRALGVKGAVLALYGIGVMCAAMGVGMSLWRARVIYALVLVFLSYIAVTAIKIARKKAIEEQMLAAEAGKLAMAGKPPEMPLEKNPAAQPASVR